MRGFFGLWAIALLAIAPCGGVAQEPRADMAAWVKEIFRNRCTECHGDAVKKGGVVVLDREVLVAKKKVVVPGKPDASELFTRITAKDESAMPEAPRPPLNAEEIEAVRKWILAGAPAFPGDVAKPAEEKKEAAFKGVAGVDYVLKRILADVRALKTEDRRFTRYFSTNHILTAGATAAQMTLFRDALAKAVNHLSWEPKAAALRPIDSPTNSVFAVDLRQLGWHVQPYRSISGGKDAGRSELNLFDLVLLEYPYGITYEGSDTFDRIVEEFLVPTGAVRPLPYVRADWFVSVATQPPLYEDMLYLPFTVAELRQRLHLDAEANRRDFVAKRAGMTVSGVSKNNRVVERHPLPGGYFWESIDYKSSKGRDNMFRDPIDLRGTGGEMIFRLPNGLQGYFVANAAGTRVEAAPTEIVTDKFAADKVVRNGLACMRCHDKGMQPFVDTVRPALLRLPGSPGFDRRAALELYPEQPEMDKLLAADARSFADAMTAVLGKPQEKEPLAPVSRHFLDDPVHAELAAGELGLADAAALKSVFRLPQFSALGLMPLGADKGVVRRDAWEDDFDSVVRGLGLGVPVVPIDAVTRRDQGALPDGVMFRTSKKNNVFEPGEEMAVFVENKSQKDLHVELFGTGSKGEKVPLTAGVVVVKPGATFRFPPAGTIKSRSGVGKEQITLFASGEPFAPGVLLRGKDVTDRVVHPFFKPERAEGRLQLANDAARVAKQTIEIETK